MDLTLIMPVGTNINVSFPFSEEAQSSKLNPQDSKLIHLKVIIHYQGF